MTIEQAVSNATEKAKSREAAEQAQQRVMTKYLYADAPEKSTGRFRDPAAARRG